MNKNTSYYIRNWKNHVSNKRLLFAIPDFEKVFGKENLINNDSYDNALVYYRTLMSKHKFDKKNSYVAFLNKLLEAKSHFEIARILYVIKTYIKEQNPKKLQDAIQSFECILKEDPTLITILPLEIFASIHTAKNKASRISNVIYVTKRHTFTCYACNKTVKGNECCIGRCSCSTHVYHNACGTMTKKKCYICSSYKIFIKSTGSETNKNDQAPNLTKALVVSAGDVKKNQFGKKKAITGYAENERCFITNNETMQYDGLC